MAWDLIETAPLDGTDLLVAVVPGGRQVVAHWDGSGWLADAIPVAPTHWQALPPPPGAEPPPPEGGALKRTATAAKKDA